MIKTTMAIINSEHSKQAITSMQSPACNHQHAITSMQSPACTHQHAITSMQSPACNHQHAITSMQSPACNHQHAITSMHPRACLYSFFFIKYYKIRIHYENINQCNWSTHPFACGSFDNNNTTTITTTIIIIILIIIIIIIIIVIIMIIRNARTRPPARSRRQLGMRFDGRAQVEMRHTHHRTDQQQCNS
jgi:hypothetical protein